MDGVSAVRVDTKQQNALFKFENNPLHFEDKSE